MASRSPSLVSSRVSLEHKGADEANMKLMACLKNVDEAEQAINQLMSAQSKLQETRNALQEMMNGNNHMTIVDLDSGRTPSGAPGDTPLSISGDGVEVEFREPGGFLEQDDAGFGTKSHDAVPDGQNTEALLLQRLQTQTTVGATTTEVEQDILEVAEATAAQLGLTKEDVLGAYRVFVAGDTDQSGKVCTEELRGLLEQVSEGPVEQEFVNGLLTKFDKDADGFLDFEEFLHVFCHTPEKKAKHLSALVNKSGEDPLEHSANFRTRMVGVPVDDIKGYLSKEVEEEQSCLQIPIIFLLFLFFCLSTALHSGTSVTGAFENAIRHDITENANFAFSGAQPFENGRMGHKGIHDVHAFEDFWSWLDLGLVPLFHPSGWSVSEARANVAARCTSPVDAMAANGWNTSQATANTPYGSNGNGAYAAVTGDLGSVICDADEESSFPNGLKGLEDFAHPTKKPYLFFNEIISGMRMRQEQLPEVECRNQDYLNRVYKTPCTEENIESWLQPDLDSSLGMNTELLNKRGGESVYFRSGMDLGTVHRHIRSLENNRWLNQRTSKVEISLPLYNNHMDMFVVVYIKFFINRAGHIYKIVKPVSMWMDPYEHIASWPVDIIFALLVAKLFTEEVYEIYKHCKEWGYKSGLSKYCNNFKNVVDWASLVYSAAIFGIWMNWCWKIGSLRHLMETADANQRGSWPGSQDNIYQAPNEEFWDVADSCAQYYETSQVVLAFYPLIIGLRFFSAFSSQPRLGLVTTTLSCAANDLAHFGVVLFTTVMIFCASAQILFGREVEEFETFGRTYISVFRGILGDMDYVALTEVGRFPAALWWVILTVLVQLVMLNMLLAIIMDVYGSVKGAMNEDADKFPTLWSQSYEIYRRWRQRLQGHRMSLHSIFLALENNPEGCYVTKSDGTREVKDVTLSMMLKLVPGLSRGQADRLLIAAVGYGASNKAQSDSAIISDCHLKLRSVGLRVQQVQDIAENLEIMTAAIEEMKKANAHSHAAHLTNIGLTRSILRQTSSKDGESNPVDLSADTRKLI